MALPMNGFMYIVTIARTTIAIRKIMPALRVRLTIVMMIANKKSVPTSPVVVIAIISASRRGLPWMNCAYLFTGSSMPAVAPDATIALNTMNATTNVANFVVRTWNSQGGLGSCNC